VNAGTIRNSSRHGIPKIVEEQPDFPFIVISPQCPANRWWSLEWLDVLFDEVVSLYRIDPNRIYLTGLSMGVSQPGLGRSSSRSALQPWRRFAVRQSSGSSQTERRSGWVFHGARDDTYL
jgi:hypothetical protein